VYPIRSVNRRKAYAERWWLYAEPRPGLREAIKGKTRYIATPAVSKHRIYTWVEPRVLCNQGTLVFARDDDYFFGVLHSCIHEVWARAQGTQVREVESGFRYTPTSTFETFPFPWPPGQEPIGNPRVEAIAAAARELVKKRDAWLNPPAASTAELKKRTLTNLYNENPTWLQNAHRDLNEAVFAAYGWSKDMTNQDILTRLLQLNNQRFTQQQLQGN
jgi:type II restriction/modification system DNA methylase subunit YeeA